MLRCVRVCMSKWAERRWLPFLHNPTLLAADVLNNDNGSSSSSSSESYAFDPKEYFLRTSFFIALVFLVCALLFTLRIVRMFQYK